MVTVYNRATGKPVEVVHPIDAKSYVAGGAYTYSNPNIKPAESKAKPTKIPVIEKEEPIIVEKENEETPSPKKPITTYKKSSRIIKK